MYVVLRWQGHNELKAVVGPFDSQAAAETWIDTQDLIPGVVWTIDPVQSPK